MREHRYNSFPACSFVYHSNSKPQRQTPVLQPQNSGFEPAPLFTTQTLNPKGRLLLYSLKTVVLNLLLCLPLQALNPKGRLLLYSLKTVVSNLLFFLPLQILNPKGGLLLYSLKTVVSNLLLCLPLQTLNPRRPLLFLTLHHSCILGQHTHKSTHTHAHTHIPPTPHPHTLTAPRFHSVPIKATTSTVLY